MDTAAKIFSENIINSTMEKKKNLTMQHKRTQLHSRNDQLHKSQEQPQTQHKKKINQTHLKI